MRILILNSEYPPIGGGAGNASANLARFLAEQGAQVTVLTAAYANLPACETQTLVQVRRIATLRRHADRSGALEQGIFIFSAFWSLLKISIKRETDTVLAFFGMPAGVAAWLVNLLTGLPYIVSLRGGDVPGFRPYDFKTYHQIMAPLLRQVWRRAGAVVANSQGLRSLAVAFDPRFEISIIPNGVDEEGFTPQPEKNWKEEPRLLFTGRLVYQKGLDLLLPALSELKNLPWVLDIVGDGPMRDSLEKETQTLGLAERVHFHGWQDRAALSAFYQKATLFVFPSRHEGMPNAVLEAMAAGLGVIATEIAGNEELVVDGVTGRLVAPESSAALAEALQSVLENKSKLQQYGQASRQRVVEFYTWRVAAHSYLSLLKAVTEKK